MLVFSVSSAVAQTLKLNDEFDGVWGPCPWKFGVCGLMTSVGGGRVARTLTKLSHTHLHPHTHTHTSSLSRWGCSTSSCSCRAGWRSGRRRSGRWLVELPSKAQGCWTGWCQSTWPSWCWSQEGRSPLFPLQRSCWHGDRPPRKGIQIMTSFDHWEVDGN